MGRVCILALLTLLSLVVGAVNTTSECNDGVLSPDNGETDVDCGGLCPGCTEGNICTADTDCASSHCNKITAKCSASDPDEVENAVKVLANKAEPAAKKAESATMTAEPAAKKAGPATMTAEPAAKKEEEAKPVVSAVGDYVLHLKARPFGISLHEKDKLPHVSKVPKSAGLKSIVEEGDIIIGVSGHPVAHMRLKELQVILKSAKLPVEMQLRKPSKYAKWLTADPLKGGAKAENAAFETALRAVQLQADAASKLQRQLDAMRKDVAAANATNAKLKAEVGVLREKGSAEGKKGKEQMGTLEKQVSTQEKQLSTQEKQLAALKKGMVAVNKTSAAKLLAAQKAGDVKLVAEQAKLVAEQAKLAAVKKEKAKFEAAMENSSDASASMETQVGGIG
jgi:hypothetical protein